MKIPYAREIEKRRTSGIISHPDALKTTLMEKLLQYGGAIQLAGMVRAKKTLRYATSDFALDESKQASCQCMMNEKEQANCFVSIGNP